MGASKELPGVLGSCEPPTLRPRADTPVPAGPPPSLESLPPGPPTLQPWLTGTAVGGPQSRLTNITGPLTPLSQRRETTMFPDALGK